MTCEEFMRWQAYYTLDPFGGKRGDYQSASIANTLVNLHSKRRIPLEDSMLRFGPTQPRDPEQIKKLAKGMFAAIRRNQVRK